MKTFVFGIDGASFDIIHQIGKKRLPNIYKLMNNGSYGTLNSTDPPHTAPGWASAVTGVSPGVHGIYQFWKTQSPEYLGQFTGSQDFGVPPIWDILNQYNQSTGIINIPMTYPPKEVDGYMIAWPLVKTIRYTYPSNLLKEIKKEQGHYLPDLFQMFTGDLSYIEEAISVIKKRVITIKYLMKQYPQDFVMVVFTEVDRVSHYYWNYVDKNSPCYIDDKELSKAIMQIYIETDRALGELLMEVGEDCTKLILSDHGFGCGYLDFHIHNYLENCGIFHKELARDEDVVDDCNVFYHQQEKYKIDWSKTKAYLSSPGSYGITINLEGRQTHGCVEAKDYDKVCNEIIAALVDVKLPDGEKIFEKVVRSKDIYAEDKQEEAPDIMLIPCNYGIMVQHRYSEESLFSYPEQKGMHRKEGIYIMASPHVMKNYEKNADIIDITPTLLFQHNIPLPNYIEGSVLPIFEEGYMKDYKASDEVVIKEQKGITGYQLTEDEKSQVNERLKALGYL